MQTVTFYSGHVFSLVVCLQAYGKVLAQSPWNLMEGCGKGKGKPFTF